MLQLLRTHGGYAGWSDDDLLDIPYARFLQATRVAAEAAGRENETAMKVAAFVGWQNAGSFGALKKGTDFGRYLRSLGLGDKRRGGSTKLSREQREREIAEARAAVAKVNKAFGMKA